MKATYPAAEASRVGKDTWAPVTIPGEPLSPLTLADVRWVQN